jgi:hypothetical protein
MLTIIAAMEQELVGLKRALGPRPPPGLDLHVIGIGRDRVEPGLRGLLPTLRQQRQGAEPPTELLLLGFAGGVDPSLSAGDLTLPGRYCRLLTQQGRRHLAFTGTPDPEVLERLRAEVAAWNNRPPELKFLEPDAAMRQHAREALVQGSLTAVETDSMTVPELVTNPNTKGELHRRYQVGTVNMEDYWVARLAGAAKVPFLSVRAVLDTAGQRLPSNLLGLSSRRPGWAAFGVAAHPWQLPALLGLPRSMRLAQASLARFALAYINHRSAEGGSLPTGN